MSLRFIYGRAGSGKSYYCLRDIKNKIENGCTDKLILMVPDQFSFQAEQNLLKIIGEKGVFKAQVMSFKRMAYKVFNEVGGLTRKHIDSTGKEMLIYKIMEENKENFKAFEIAARQRGFVETINDTITELKRYNITPDILISKIDTIEDNLLLRDKLEDISLIYNKFQGSLSNNYIDSEDDLNILAEKIEETDIFENAEIWIDEFSSFTPQQYTVLKKLIRKCKRVTVSLCSDSQRTFRGKDKFDFFYTTENTENELISIAQENSIKIDKPIELTKKPYYRFKESEEIGHLEEQYYAFPYITYEKEPKDISIFKAKNIYTEVENAAVDIVNLVRDKKIRFKDIAVVCRDLSSYEKMTKAIFREYNIPYFIDRKKDVDTNILVILINSLLQIYINNWSYEAIFRYLKTGLTNVDKNEIDIVENYVLASGIRGKKRWKEPWTYIYSEDINKDTKELENINDIREKIVGPIYGLGEKLKGKKSVKEISTNIYEFLMSINIEEKIQILIAKFKAEKNVYLAEEYKSIWNIIVELLDQMVEVMGDEVLSLEEFQKVLAMGFSQHKMGLIPPSLDSVLVGSIDRIKSHNICVLYILGVNDGIFPSSFKDEGILSDRDREYLNSVGMELAQTARSKAFEEQYLIYTTLTTAGKYLRISYPVADADGKALRPSIIITRLKTIFPKLTEKSDILEDESKDTILNNIASPSATFNKLLSEMRLSEDGKQLRPLWKEVYNWYSSKEQWREKCNLLNNALRYTNQTESISEESAKQLYIPNEKWSFSASRLEKYVECPFAYYVQYGLKAKERRLYTLNAPDLGSFMHKVLYLFSEYMKENKISWNTLDKKICNEKISELVDNVVKESTGSILNSSPRYRYLTERIKRLLTRSTYTVSQQIKKGGFYPLGYEAVFSQGSSMDAVKIPLANGEVINIIGKIDRIDVMEQGEDIYVRIVDYKSGNKSFKLSDVYYGLQIQLLVYLEAVINYLEDTEKTNVYPGGIFYFKVDDPMIKAESNLPKEEIEKAIEKALKMKGLLLADENIIREMDNEIDGDSTVVPARINKDGSIGKSQVATLEQFKALRDHIINLIKKSCSDMLKGNIKIRPYKKKEGTPCSYCMYSPICGFDTSFEDNKYKILKEKKDDEVWKLLENQNGQKNS